MTTRTKALPLLVLTAALLGACSTMPSSTPSATSTSPHSSLRSSPNLSVGTPYFLTDFKPQDVRRDVMQRYMCTDGHPVQCQCMSKLSPTCRCACVPFGFDVRP
jgi:hypothetical protein